MWVPWSVFLFREYGNSPIRKRDKATAASAAGIAKVSVPKPGRDVVELYHLVTNYA